MFNISGNFNSYYLNNLNTSYIIEIKEEVEQGPKKVEDFHKEDRNAVVSPAESIITIEEASLTESAILDANKDVLIDIAEEALLQKHPLTPLHLEQLKKFISQIKIYDQSLKIINGMLKANGLKEASAAAKELRNFIKYIDSINHLRKGKSSDQKEASLAGKIYDPQTFKKMMENVSGLYTVVNQSLNYLVNTGAIEQLVKPTGFSYEMIKPHLYNFLSIVDFPVAEIVLLYKIASLRTSIQYWKKEGAPDEGSRKNWTLLRGGIELARSAAKVGVHLTGFYNPAIKTTLAVSGVFTGIVGNYLIYTDKRDKT